MYGARLPPKAIRHRNWSLSSWSISALPIRGNFTRTKNSTTYTEYCLNQEIYVTAFSTNTKKLKKTVQGQNRACDESWFKHVELLFVIGKTCRIANSEKVLFEGVLLDLV
jgi:hypothetical protein